MPPTAEISDEALEFESERARARSPHRPLAGLLLAVLGGMAAATYFDLTPAVSLIASAVSLALAASPLPAPVRTSALFLSGAFQGAAHLGMELRPPAPAHWANWLVRPAAFLRVAGTINDDPIALTTGRPGEKEWRFTLRLEARQYETAWRRACGRVEVQWRNANDNRPAFGERWLVEGSVRKLEGQRGRPPRLFLTASEGQARRIAPARPGFRAALYALRHATAERLAFGVAHDPVAPALIQALMLGYRHELPQEIRDLFARTGTLHIIAISGAHVGMLALLLLTAVRAVGLPRHRWAWAMVPLLIGYAFLTGSSASAVRACLMASVYFVALALREEPDAISGLAFSALAILATAPIEWREPGFVLSFVIAAALILLVPPVRDFLSRPFCRADSAFFQPDDQPAAASGWRRYASDALAVNFVAWLFSAPLMAHYFNLVSPVALLSNLAVVPLAFAALFCATLSVVGGAVHVELAEIYNFAAISIVRLLVRFVEWSAALPFAFWRVESPGPLITIVLILALIALIRGEGVPRRTACAVLALLGGVWLWNESFFPSLRVRYAHLGPAPVACVKVPGADPILVDTGPAFTGPRLMRFLDEYGIDRLSAVIVTRQTVDRLGALPTLIRLRPVSEIWVADAPPRSTAARKILSQMIAEGIPVRRLHRHQEGALGFRGVRWRILHPPKGARCPDSIACGLAVVFEHGKDALLIVPGRRGEPGFSGEKESPSVRAIFEMDAAESIVEPASDGAGPLRVFAQRGWNPGGETATAAFRLPEEVAVPPLHLFQWSARTWKRDRVPAPVRW